MTMKLNQIDILYRIDTVLQSKEVTPIADVAELLKEAIEEIRELRANIENMSDFNYY